MNDPVATQTCEASVLHTGVYVGCMYQEYASVLAAAGSTLTAAAATGTSLSFMVGRCACML